MHDFSCLFLISMLVVLWLICFLYLFYFIFLFVLFYFFKFYLQVCVYLHIYRFLPVPPTAIGGPGLTGSYFWVDSFIVGHLGIGHVVAFLGLHTAQSFPSRLGSSRWIGIASRPQPGILGLPYSYLST